MDLILKKNNLWCNEWQLVVMMVLFAFTLFVRKAWNITGHFQELKGIFFSVVWSLDAKKIFAGGSDGCIRCWDLNTTHEVYRITTGFRGLKTGADICIWSQGSSVFNLQRDIFLSSTATVR